MDLLKGAAKNKNPPLPEKPYNRFWHAAQIFFAG
jgi:hypothetical protein